MAFTSLSSKPVERAAYAIQSESHEKYFCRRLIRLRTWSGDISVETRGLVDGIALMDSRNGAICALIVFVEEHGSLGYHWILMKPLAPTPFEHAHYLIENCVLDIGAWINTLGTDCTSETGTVEEISRG